MKKAYHHGDLRRALLSVALRLVDEKGVGALTLRELARRSGVTEAAPYRHFSSKDALVAAVASEGFRLLRRRVARALDGAGSDPASRLRALGAAYVGFAVARPAYFRVMFGREVAGSHGFTALWEAGQENFRVLLGEIVAAQRAGVLGGEDPGPAARVAWSTVHGLAALLVEGLLQRQGLGPRAGRGVEALAAEAVDAVVGGLLARPGSRRPSRADRRPPARRRGRAGRRPSPSR